MPTMCARNIALRALRSAPKTSIRSSFSTTTTSRGLFSSDDKDAVDRGKQGTDTVDQAKNPEGSNPAQQQANVVKQQSGESGAAQTQNTPDAELTEKKKRGEIAGKKPGEEAVNPAVKGSGGGGGLDKA